MFDVITIGSAVQDAFLVSRDFQIIRSTKFRTGVGECVSLGSKIEVDDFYLTTGGGGTNTAATFASLGLKTACITRIGNDAPGNAVLSDLKKYKVSTKFIRILKKGMTGYSTLLTTTDGERSVLVHRGVSNNFSAADIPINTCNTKWLYVSSLGGDIALARMVFTKAKKKGIRIAWNPGSKELKSGKRKLNPLLKLVDVLLVNKEEARILSGTNAESKKLCENLTYKDNIVLVSDGIRGVHVCKNGKVYHGRPTGVNAISRTGAGDALGSSFVASLLLRKGIEEAIQIGILNAESVIQSFGAKQGILKKVPSKKSRSRISIKTL